jgi:hypothetical protein
MAAGVPAESRFHRIPLVTTVPVQKPARHKNNLTGQFLGDWD